MSLAKAELRRLLKRRLTRYVLILLVLGLGTIAVSFSVASHKIGPAEVAAAQAESQRQYEQAVVEQQRWVSECEAAKARGEDISRNYPPDCGKDYVPRREDFDPKWNLPFEFHFRDEFGIFISVFAGLLALFGFIAGASYIGAEWHTGGMMNLLLWRPRRLTVLLTKLGVLLGTVLGVGVALGAVWTLAFWLIGRYDGQLGKVTSGVWQSFAITGARGIGLALAVAAVAFGLASVGRHTAMALGAAVAVGAVSEIGLRIALAVAGVPFGDRFVLSTYVLSWFNKTWVLTDWNSCNFVAGECRPKEMLITWQDSALVFGIGTAAVLAVAMVSMRRRDIT